VTAATSRPAPDAGPWSRDDFVRRLRTVLERRYHHLHPFNRRMHAGELSRAELELWVANRFYYQVNIPIKDALILSNCPEPDVRRNWIQRIVDHDGRDGEEGGIEAWVRLGEAMGVSRDDLLTHRRLLPGVRFAVDAYVNFCRTRPWLEAVAAARGDLEPLSLGRSGRAAVLQEPSLAGAARRGACARSRDRAQPHACRAAARRRGTRIQVRRPVVSPGRRRARATAGSHAVSPGPAAGLPRIAPKARLQWDEVRKRHVLLYPEGLVALNETGAAILRLCDGSRSVADVAATLTQRYQTEGIERDVGAFLDGLAAKGLVTYET